MSIAYVNKNGATSLGATIDLTLPSGTYMQHVVVAFVYIYGLGEPSVPSCLPPDDWTLIHSGTTTAGSKLYAYWHRVGEGETTHRWRHDGSYLDVIWHVEQASFSGVLEEGDPIDVDSDTAYETDNSTIRAASITTTGLYRMVLFWGQMLLNAAETTYPSGFTSIFDLTADDEWSGFTPGPEFVGLYKMYDAAGATGDQDATADNTGTDKRAFLIALTPEAWTTDIPVITEPEEGERFFQEVTIDLTASATDEEGEDVLYRWWYSHNGGEVTSIGDSLAVESGTAATYEWDTTGFSGGLYELTCKGVNESGYESLAATVNIILGNVVLLTPDVDSCHTPGAVTITAQGFAQTTGNVTIEIQMDTVNPPNWLAPTEGYQLLQISTPQGLTATLTGELTLGTWYFRGRVNKLGVASDWAECRRIFCVEGLRLDAGSSVSQSIQGSANRVTCVVKGDESTLEETVTNTTIAPTYATSPREIVVFAPEGTEPTAAQSIAAAQLALRQQERESYSGLKLKLEDGMKLNRGDQVGLKIPRMGVDTVLPVRELVFDVAGDNVDVVLGEFHELRTDQDALFAIAQKLQQLQKETAR